MRSDRTFPCRLASPLRPPAIEFKRDNLQMHCLRKLHFVCTGLLLLSPALTLEATQQAATASSSTPAQDSASKADQPDKKKYSHADDFLIRGTVFNEKALSFPAVELRFRKEGQKKYKWETYTNSRGEFAVRVPQGSNYEVLVHVKGFADQTRMIEAKGGGNEETVAFRMQPVKGDKK
jgi:hypothetical protein